MATAVKPQRQRRLERAALLGLPAFDGDLVRLYREGRGWTPGELGRALNVTDRCIRHWETGLRQPSADNLYALARLMNLDMEDLFR